ncbi:hypothetical protein RRF57_000345 [Xylaria bambusicola]|uniref:Uncharacterized protein n=1 Tax=Xylaria bambusicola TaxID=326684 RepID=A0AAN7UEE4_9PEZI
MAPIITARLATEVLYALAWLAELGLFFLCSANTILLFLIKLRVIKIRSIQPYSRKPLTKEQFRILLVSSAMMAYIAFTGVLSSWVLYRGST